VIKNVGQMASSSQNRKAWITVRFVIILFLQAAPRVLYNVYYLLLTPVGNYLTPIQKAEVSWLPTIGILACYYLNAVVVIWSNKSLRKWLVGKYVNLSASSSGSSTPQTASTNEKDRSFLTNYNIELSKTQDDSV